MEIKKAQKFMEVEETLRNAQLVLIDDDSTAYTCMVNGVNECWEVKDELQELLNIYCEDTDEDLKELTVSFNPAMAHDDGDQFDIPIMDIVNGYYEINVIK